MRPGSKGSPMRVAAARRGAVRRSRPHLRWKLSAWASWDPDGATAERRRQMIERKRGLDERKVKGPPPQPQKVKGGRMKTIEETREETVARWKLERPDLAEMSEGVPPFTEIDRLTAAEAYMVGAMAGRRLLKVKGSPA